jgi:hypothetical protein
MGVLGWVSALHALVTHMHNFPLPSAFLFLFTTPSQRCATSVSSNGKFAAVKVGLFAFSLERHASELARRLQENGGSVTPMPASDRQSGFHHSFFEPIFCFLSGPARSAASGAPLPSASAPCFNCFRVSASTVSDSTTVLICDSELSYLPSFYLLTRFLNCPFFLGHQRINGDVQLPGMPDDP